MSNVTINKNQNREKIDRFPSLARRNEIRLPYSVDRIFSNTIIEKKVLENKKLHPAKFKIKQYFDLDLSSRAEKRQEYAIYIKSVEDVFEVLNSGNTKGIVEAYDAAVDLLAECDKNVIIEAIETASKRFISDKDLEIALSWEKNWEILIKGLACAIDLEPYKKMTVILSLCDRRYKLSRLIKLTLIDAIVDLDIDTDIAEVMLKLFSSERESDYFVRDYARKSVEGL
jgi:hypothetical protein